MSTVEVIIRRKPVNGRVGKKVETCPISQTKNKLSGQGWDKRQILRRQAEILSNIKKENLAAAEAAKLLKKKDLESRRKRKEENEKRAEVVQQVSAAKMKRMKKKQLRQLRKA